MPSGIYKFENKINHMIYIGLALDLQERYNKHKKNINDLKRQEDFYIALRQYGWDNFDYEILESFDEYDCDKLSQLENYYIIKYNSLKPNGYNMVPGGYNGSGLAKGKIVEQYDLEGKFIAEYCSCHEASRQTGINYSSICSCARGENIQIKGFQWKYKDDDKIISSINKKYITQIVYQFDENGKYIQSYSSLKEAAEKNEITNSAICQACADPLKTVKGYHWSYNKNYVLPEKLKNGQTYKKAVEQYDLNGNYITTYNTITEASKATGVNNGNIGLVCKGKRASAGGFKWKYVDKIKKL